ncbi:DNA-binding protein [Halobacteriales archaeon QS_1_68_17]|nr:MAG: DNA-binding protein [Halobacteriales archaeon QS_1_68_17]
MTDDAPDGYAVPDGESPVACRYCGRPFGDDQLLALHRGLEHGDRLGDDERAAFEDALASERDQLRRFRLKALAALVALYFGLLIAYAAFA